MKKVTLGRIIVSIAAVVFLAMLVNVAMAQMPPQNQPVATNGIPAYQGASAGDVQAQAEQGAAQVGNLNESLEEGPVVTASEGETAGSGVTGKYTPRSSTFLPDGSIYLPDGDEIMLPFPDGSCIFYPVPDWPIVLPMPGTDMTPPYTPPLPPLPSE